MNATPATRSNACATRSKVSSRSTTKSPRATPSNLDACHPPPASFAGPALVALADRRLRGAADAIERGMTYTADNQLRLLQTGRDGEKK